MDDDLDEAVVAVRADRAAFASDVKAMLAELDGPFAEGAYRAGRVLERSLIAAIRSGQAGFEDLRRTALGVLAEIAAASIRGGLNELLGGGKKGGIGVSLAQLFGAIVGAPGKAIGGPVSPGRPYLVGERGPELFVPAASGRIEAMRPLGRGGGGREVRVNVTINAPASGEARALQVSGRQVARAVKAALMRVED
ncbi:tail tape measure protein [Sphingosinicella sp.]|uniref:tail tape measure protein n=1 Tax=Sphingosinicella sp. TaxID=1917971 RepID=UPI0040377D04